jgi:sugar O-acyltransferase (sialic acid O-acetyltransferase NeuD family)
MVEPILRVLVVGAGGHGQVAGDVLLCAAAQGSGLQLAGFLDDDANLWGTVRLGVPILGAVRQAAQYAHDALLLGIGDNATRRRLYESLAAAGERVVTVRHPSAQVGRAVEIGAGTLLGPAVVVNTGSQVGANVILNSGSIVEHHNQIGDYAHIAPGARLGGEVAIGAGTLVGMGALVLPGVQIGPWSMIGAGAVVTKDLPARVVAVGAPARVVRNTEP